MKLFSGLLRNLLFKKNDSFFYRIQLITGFCPSNINLYKQALTHKSVAQSNAKGVGLDNERLEFLGDAVLDTVLAGYLFKKYPYENEGFLTQMRSKVVNRKQLDHLAKVIGLNELLEINQTRKFSHSHIYGNAFEAFIGAVYLDKGFKRTQKFIIQQILHHHVDIKELQMHDTNYKSQILEWSQKKGSDVVFVTVKNLEKENSFISSVRLEGNDMEQAMGRSKKEAEQNAAFIALKYLKIIEQ